VSAARAGAPLFEAHGLSKAFPGVLALERVDLDLAAGEVHALVGENGAGKSTLIKVLTGVIRPHAGRMRLAGEPYAPRSPHEAQENGVATVHQELDLVPRLSLAENLFLGRQPRRGLGLDWRAMEERARARLAELGLAIDVRRAAGDCSAAVRQLACIARALELDARLLVLDEPTSSLDAREARELLAQVRELAARGLAVLFVAHSLEQVFAVADRISVLRNGRRVGTFDARSISRLELIQAMTGRQLAELEALERPRRARERGQPFLRARGLGRRGAIEPFDLDLAPGEVVALAGLLGSGRSELARLVFGADRATQGTLALDGVPRRLRSPRDGVRLGLAFTPEDRKEEGALPGLSVRENIALVAQRRAGLGLASRRAQERLAWAWIERLGIAVADPEQRMGTLSGGNQQKVLLARWLAASPRALILDEPTRGVDVGSKLEIERIVNELAEEGVAVLLVSSALDEVARHAERVLVLRERRVTLELAGDSVSEPEILRAIAGGESDEP
jgi:monosaccharide-transporting ATPase